MGLELSETVEFAFRRRYRLAPTDPRFLNSTHDDMLVDYWAWRHVEDPKLREEAIDPDFDEEVAAMERQLLDEDPSDWEDVASDTFD